MKNNPTEQQIKNYPELRAYLEGSNESDVKRKNVERILEGKLKNVPSDYEFHILDVGCSDGEMSLPLFGELKKRLPKLECIALEPEKPAFEKLVERIKGQNLDFIQPVNGTIEAYLLTPKAQKDLFDFILFSQSFYYFPKSEWDAIISDTRRLLKPNGFVMAILDSREGKAYKLCDLISHGKADTLEFGGLYFAEDLEQFLINKGIDFKTNQFPIFVFIKDNKEKLNQFARILAFLYRTFPEIILAKHKEAVEAFLEECRSESGYILENLVKVITFAK